MTLRMFALIIPKPVCVSVRSWMVNPAYISGPDINTMLESRGARLAVMLEENSFCPACSLFSMKGAGGQEGGSGHATQCVGFPLLFSCIGSVFLPEQDKKRHTFVCVSLP